MKDQKSPMPEPSMWVGETKRAWEESKRAREESKRAREESKRSKNEGKGESLGFFGVLWRLIASPFRSGDSKNEPARVVNGLGVYDGSPDDVIFDRQYSEATGKPREYPERVGTAPARPRRVK